MRLFREAARPRSLQDAGSRPDCSAAALGLLGPGRERQLIRQMLPQGLLAPAPDHTRHGPSAQQGTRMYTLILTEIWVFSLRRHTQVLSDIPLCLLSQVNGGDCRLAHGSRPGKWHCHP